MKYLFIILILFSTIINAQNSGGNKKTHTTPKKTNELSYKPTSCDELIYYRDNTLANDLASVYTKHQIAQDDIDRMNKIKDDLLNQKGWDELMSLGYSTSDTGVKIAQIAQVIKTECDLIRDLVGLMPTGENTLMNKGIYTSEKVYNQIKLGINIKKITKGEADRVLYDAVLDEFNLVGKSAKAALKFSDNLKKLIKIPEERQQLKDEVDRVLNMLAQNVEIYKQKVDESSITMLEMKQVVEGINKYWTENCNNTIGKKTNTNPTIKNKYVTPPAIPNTKKATGNSFYVFFDVSVTINMNSTEMTSVPPIYGEKLKFSTSKQTNIISAPVFYEGKRTDSMSKQKEDFKHQIEMEFLNKPKYYKDAFRNINNESIKVHYGKPYSTVMLKSENDVFEAIESYKSMLKETLEGLGEVDFLELK